MKLKQLASYKSFNFILIEILATMFGGFAHPKGYPKPRFLITRVKNNSLVFSISLIPAI
jgi:hypothetical protein